jgi:hypothetical protein
VRAFKSEEEERRGVIDILNEKNHKNESVE